ncbi:hypothetical protein [Sphingomonas sp.]|uniref:hypothetical protein n=1 Tax=Sphingomonas sp. TaxID=28214 RepID=UPI00286DF669|nr:hypothetical protein [Sphingomonas sp.]
MSAALRFLAMALVAWTGVRVATVGLLPTGGGVSLARGPPAVSTIVPTEFPPIDPPLAFATPAMAEAAPPIIRFASLPDFSHAYPLPVRPPPPHGSGYTPIDPAPAPIFYAPIPQLDDWPLARMAAAFPRRRSGPAGAQSTPAAPGAAAAIKPKLDRVQLTSWALLRGRPGDTLGTASGLASNPALGGSQAGARLSYAFNRSVAASLRMSAPIGSTRGGEVAAGIKLTPLRAVPVSLTVERRHAFGRFAGRSAFAMFLEGGVYQRPMPLKFSLDAYAQGGVVGLRRRDFFVDGAFAMTRPVYGRLSAGFGMWGAWQGGSQAGVHRIDAGPRVSMQVRDNIRVHLDWRHRLSGKAEPGSGPALTLAADF